jgi:hypothetical protein
MPQRLSRRAILALGAALLPLGCMRAEATTRLAPQSTLILVRHGDRDGEALSAQGRARAAALVAAIADLPLDAILAPGLQRNLDTAAPLAAARALPVTRMAAETAARRLPRSAAGRSVIWIGNMGNLTAIWAALALPGEPPLAYGELAVIRTDAAGTVRVERRNVAVPG